jgi:hypothetical protein
MNTKELPPADVPFSSEVLQWTSPQCFTHRFDSLHFDGVGIPDDVDQFSGGWR